MRASLRFLLSLCVATLVDFGFFNLTVALVKYHPKQREIKRVIKISLLRRASGLTIVKAPSASKGTGKKTTSPPVKPQVESAIPFKEPMKGKKSESKKGGLKPLQGNLPTTYIELVKKAIEESIFYPLEAIEGGEQGIVTVRFVIDRTGKALECSPLEGKSEILKKATCIAINRAKFPPIPKNIKNKTLSFELDVEYNLQELFKNM